MGTLVSVNVGMPKDVAWQGKTVFTGVFKEPVTGPRMVRKLNVDGDGQGDLAGHGGEQRAVFVYQIDSYRTGNGARTKRLRPRAVRRELHGRGTGRRRGLHRRPLPDRTAVFEVTQPRVTCYRVGIRMNDPRIPALLVSHRRPGFYLRVLEEGEVQAGDEIVKVASGPEQMTVAEVDALLYLPGHPRQQLLRALRIPALSPGWQASFRALLDGDAGQRQRRPDGGEPAARLAGLPPADRRRESTRESDSVVSIRLEDPDGAPLPAARPGQYLTLRIQPDDGHSSVLRNYSLSGPPGAGYYRISVKREPDGTASGYLHTRLRVGDQLEIAAPRGTFILDPRPSAGAPDQRRHRRYADARHASRTGGGAFRARGLVAARRTQQPRALLRRRGSRAPRLAPERPHPRLLQPPASDRSSKAATSTAPAVSPPPCSPSSSRRATPRHTSAGRRPFMEEISAGLAAIGLDASRIHTEPFGPAPGQTPGIASTPARTPHPPAGHPEAARRSSSRAATSPSRWSGDYASLLELAEACDVPVRWSCRTGVCHTCETTLISGNVDYSPDPVEPPADGSALICCAQPHDNLVLDL